MPTETLTLQIAGDSAPLQRELDAVEQRLATFQSRLASVTDAGRGFETLASRFAQLARPIEQVGRMLDRLGAQIERLAQIPVRLNVAPALQGLALVSQAIDAVAAKLQTLAAPRPFLPGPLPLPADPGPIRRFADGGYVAGPPGLDRVPALLSAGEFVLRESAVRQLGTTFLHQLNQSAAPRPSAPVAGAPPSTSNAITNVGGIAIHVTRPTDVAHLLRDLRHNEFRLRNRRG